MMTTKELKTNDIIVQRAGHIGMYIEKDGNGYIIYPNGGYDEVDVTYNEDLTDAIDGEKFDIMLVYRYDHGVICFNDYKEADLVFVRDEAWKMPE